MNKNLLPVLALVWLSGCAIGPDYKRPNVDMPDNWPSNSMTSANPDIALYQDWWVAFRDPVLDQMIESALQNNQDLAAAIARVDQAAALARISRTNLLPKLDGTANYDRGRVSELTNDPTQPTFGDVTTIGGSATWELDLWGKLRRRYEASKANFYATAFERDAARLSIAAQVAQTYFQLRALDAQLQVSMNTLKSREESLVLRDKRFRGGLTSALDLRQAQAEAASARADVPRYRQQMEQTEHALSVLVGKSPREMMNRPQRGKELEALAMPPTIPTDLPSSLLQRRPDVAAAEQRLVAANAKIGEARAAYFPSIGLTGSIGTQSPTLEGLFTGPAATWSFVGNLTAPIFHFGEIGYGVDAAKAGQRQALAQYQSTIQSAFRDTLDSLSALTGTSQQETALRQQLKANSESLRLAQLRYDNGYSDYLDVLDAERSTYQSQLSVISARQERLDAVVSLYQALGGGWDLNKPKLGW